jgi:anti-anti-sigma regulatory factor
MACKIEPIVAHESDSAFRVGGELRGDTVKALEELLMNVSSKVALDLRDVTIVDWHGVAVLALCERNGAKLLNCPAYLREWVTHESAKIRSEEK